MSEKKEDFRSFAAWIVLFAGVILFGEGVTMGSIWRDAIGVALMLFGVGRSLQLER